MEQGSGYAGYRREPSPAQDAGEALARIALIQGGMALVCVFFIPFIVPFILGSISLIMAFLSRGYNKTYPFRAKVAIALAGAAVGANLLFTIFSLGAFWLQYSSNPAFRQELNEEFKKQNGMDLEEYFDTLSDQAGEDAL